MKWEEGAYNAAYAQFKVSRDRVLRCVCVICSIWVTYAMIAALLAVSHMF